MGSACSSPARRLSAIHRRPSRHEMSDMRVVSPDSFVLPPSAAGFLPNGLTLKDAHLLRKMWPSNSIEQAYNIGLEIFELLFRLEPEVKDFFPCLRPESVSESPLRSVGDFQNTVIRFVSMLTLCVKYCDQPQQLDGKLFELGRRHRQYVPHAQINHFRVFEKAIAMVMRRRAEEGGKDEKEETDFGYGCTAGCAFHPSIPMDKACEMRTFRNPKEQVRAIIAWTSLAAYIVREIMDGFNATSDDTHKNHDQKQ